MRYLLLACLLHAMNVLQAQDVKVRVVDAQTMAPVPGAEVRIKSYKRYTDKQGFVSAFQDTAEISIEGYSDVRTRLVEGLVVKLEPLNFLSEVVVSGSRDAQKRSDIPLAISKINAATIADTRATALHQLLNKSAGVYMVNLGNEQHTMAIRQPITYNALYLYLEDGLPIRPTGLFNHNALYEINMNSVKNIEVIKGPASSLYGSNAIGGSVNFISSSGFAGSGAKIMVQGDGYNYFRTDVSTGVSKGNLGIFVGGYTARQRNSWQDYTDFDKHSLSLKTTYDINTSTRLSFAATYNYLNTQTPGSLDSARFYSRSYGSNQRFTYREVKAFRSSARVDRKWDSCNASFLSVIFRDNSTGQLPGYYISDIRDSQTKAYVRSVGQENNQSFNSYGLLLQHRSDFDFLKSKIIGGVYIDNSPSAFYAEQLNITKDLNQNYYTGYQHTDSLIDDYRIKLFNSAAFVQYQMNPLAALRITAGLRYDHLSYNFDNLLPADRSKYKQQERNNYNILAPKLGATYDFGKGYGSYVNFSIGFQPPETSSLYSSRQSAKLKQATFSNYEAGAWLPFSEKMSLELSLFTMLGTNEIISVLMPDNTTQNQNAGKTEHSGVEYTLSYKFLKQLSLRMAGTFARHTYREYSEVISGLNQSYDGQSMPNAPSTIINSEIVWKPSYFKGFRLAAEWQHLSSFFVNSENSKSYKGYDVYNLRLGYDSVGKFMKGAGIWMNVLNVTDELYATNVTGNQYGVTYNAAPPRTVSLGLSYSINR